MPRLGLLADLTAVALGGAIGALLRYAITAALPALPGSKAMFGTMVVNVLGCLAIGSLGQWVDLDAQQWSERQLLLLRVGFLGSLTTFSTFAAESWSLGAEGRLTWMLFHLAAHLLVGFFAFWIGGLMVRTLMG